MPHFISNIYYDLKFILCDIKTTTAVVSAP
jgi:hypothetical protein